MMNDVIRKEEKYIKIKWKWFEKECMVWMNQNSKIKGKIVSIHLEERNCLCEPQIKFLSSFTLPNEIFLSLWNFIKWKENKLEGKVVPRMK